MGTKNDVICAFTLADSIENLVIANPDSVNNNEWNLLSKFLKEKSFEFYTDHCFSTESDVSKRFNNIIIFRSETMHFGIISEINLSAIGHSLSILDAIKLYLTNKPSLLNIQFKKGETNE